MEEPSLTEEEIKKFAHEIYEGLREEIESSDIRES